MKLVSVIVPTNSFDHVSKLCESILSLLQKFGSYNCRQLFFR